VVSFFRPLLGLLRFFDLNPTARAVGYILSPLAGLIDFACHTKSKLVLSDGLPLIAAYKGVHQCELLDPDGSLRLTGVATRVMPWARLYSTGSGYRLVADAS